jgi:hypothetical protein
MKGTKMPRLVYEHSIGDKEVHPGDIHELNDGERWVVISFTPPHKPASSGKVYMQRLHEVGQEFYVGVIGAKWIERTDRG